MGNTLPSSPVYFEDFLYDLEKDPIEKNNLVKDPAYKEIRAELKSKLIKQMVDAGERKPLILPKIF